MPEVTPQIDTASTKKQLVNLIAASLYRFVNSDSYDTKSLIMMVAALTILNTGDDSQAINTARRLATAALTRSSKTKN